MIEDIAQTNFVYLNEGYHLYCNEITVRMKSLDWDAAIFEVG